MAQHGVSVSPAKTSARSVALQALLECERKNAFVQEVLDTLLRRLPLGTADRRLATMLVYGVLRRRGTLDALLRRVVNRPLAKVEPWLLNILRLGAYQLALLTQIPPHAALYETVELAAQLKRPKAKGFLNGVLRALVSLLTKAEAPDPGADALPTEAGRYRRLARPVLPDPAKDPVEYLAAGFSLPVWLAERWLARYGWDECIRLGFWFAGPVAITLRTNALHCERSALLDRLTQAGIRAEPGREPQAVRLLDAVPIRELPGYAEGWFVVQDESAQRVGAALDPKPGMEVLDLCAAPGGKTTHLAELMENEGRIVACDVDERRLRTVGELAERQGISVIEPRLLDADRNEEPPAGPFDAVLVDVPCSNTGVLGKRPEARWRLKPREFDKLVPLQSRLLLWACERVKSGSSLVYSTCSIEPEENGQVVRNVLRVRPDMTLEAEEELSPGRPADGGYWARLRKREEQHGDQK